MRTCLLLKNLVMWCLGGKSLLGDKHMLHRCVFFQYRTGAAMCDGQFIHLHHKYGLLSSSLPLIWYVPNSWQSLKEKKMEKLCDDNDIRVPK